MKLPIAFLFLLSLAALGCSGDGAVNITSPAGAPALTVAGNPAALAAGETANLTALLTGPDGRVVADGSVAWTSSDSTIAAVVSTGPRTATITAVGPGVADITAGIAGVSAKVNLAVSALRAFIYNEQDGMSFIPTPTGASGLVPAGINDAGQVAGSIVYRNAPRHAFLWSRADGLRDLGALTINGRTTETYAMALNQSGEVVGYSSSGTGTAAIHPFRWTQAEGMVDLGLLPGASYAYATAINRAGEVVGSTSGQGGPRIFRWTAARGMEYQVPDLLDYSPTAINDAGQVTLSLSDPYDYGYFAASVLSPSGVKTDIAKTDYAKCYCSAAALAINNSGVVAGTANNHAFTWTATAGISSLAGVPQGVYSEASGINDNGTVVGSFHQNVAGNTFVLRSFLWSASRGYREIPLGTNQRSLSVTGINNKDQVVGVVQ